MYSYEDRIRAVELYIKLGKRTSPTIRQLGYPTKNALKGWYREYQQRLDLPLGYHRARAAIGDKYVGCASPSPRSSSPITAATATAGCKPNWPESKARSPRR